MDKNHCSGEEKKKNGEPINKGKLQADATVADQYITFPTDNGLLNTARKQSQNLIDFLYEKNGKEGIKPRTYRKNLDKAFLGYSKKKKKAKKTHRKMTRSLLEAVKRNLHHIENMLDVFEQKHIYFPLEYKDQRILWIIKHLYEQQREMYDTKKQSHPDRLVSVHQPHIRAIPRGKTKAQIEFGSKLGVSLDQGFARINTLSWQAYHEGRDLTKQVEAYKQIHGYYPELVLVDKAYATRENRKWLKEREIRITASPLGRKKIAQTTTKFENRKRKKEFAERNHIEGKFGQAKNGYGLNKIKARLQATSESWVGCIFFIMNLLNYKKKVFLCLILKVLTNTWQSYSILGYQALRIRPNNTLGHM
jgi:IS5 family transposase